MSTFVDVRVGDFRDVLADLEPSSVDLVLTDPPYPDDFTGLWSPLGELAARVLRPGGSLMAWSGKRHLPEVLERLSASLAYRWTFALPLNGAPNMHYLGVRGAWRPIVWFESSPAPPARPKAQRFLPDVIPNGPRRKDLHEWQQEPRPARQLIAWLTETLERPLDVVDPFLGSGSFGVAAKQCGAASFVGAEIDPEHARRARERIAAVTEPLFPVSSEVEAAGKLSKLPLIYELAPEPAT